MIYIACEMRVKNIFESKLREKDLIYQYITPTIEELKELINSKNFKGIYLSDMYQDYLKIDSDFIYMQNEDIKYINLFELAFSEFLDRNNIDMDNKTVLILGSSKKARSVYRIIKQKFTPTVYISTITEEPMNLKKGDRKIKKVEVKNMRNSDYIINATELGNLGEVNSCMLEGENLIETKCVIDLLIKPNSTMLQLRYRDKANIYYSNEIECIKYDMFLELVNLKH